MYWSSIIFLVLMFSVSQILRLMRRSKFLRIKNRMISKYNNINIEINEFFRNYYLEDLKRKELIKKMKIFLIIFLILYIISIYIFNKLDESSFIIKAFFLLMPIIYWVIIFSVVARINAKYEFYFKDNILSKIICNHNKKLIYVLRNQDNKKEFILEEEYKFCYFNTTFNDLEAKSLIVDTENKNICEVFQLTVYGDERYDTIKYKGLLLKNENIKMGFELFINSIKKKSVNKNGYCLIKTGNSKFDSKFEIYSNNEVLANRLLKPDFINYLLSIQDLGIDIRIFNDKIYLRTGFWQMFKPCLISKKVEINNMVVSLALYNEMVNLSNYLKKLSE